MPINSNIDYKNYICIFVCNSFKNSALVDTDAIVENFLIELQKLSDEEICEILLFAGFIPDLYLPDSNQEKLFTKLVEVLVAHWANRMGFKGTPIKTKGSFEDISIELNNKTIVCDTKAFRLGRSQKAPNVKDFLKLEDIRKWLSRYQKKLGGLVVFPKTHEWKDGSDVYQYCSTKDAPTVMLPFRYLALILNFKSKFTTTDLEKLWDYNRLFPNPLKDKKTNKTEYWNVINKELKSILNISDLEFDSYLEQSNVKITNYICSIIAYYCNLKTTTIEAMKAEIETYNIETLKNKLLALQISNETKKYDEIIKRIKNFRLG